jgi:hypothetical protein
MLSHVCLSVVYTLHRTLRIVLYSTPYSLLSSPVGFSVSVCMHCSAMYSTKYILLYTVLYSISPPRFSVSVLALLYIVFYRVQCYVHCILLSLLSSPVLCESACVQCSTVYSVALCTVHRTLLSLPSPVLCESACVALLYEVFYEV